jgi:hypothetical protein
MPLGPLLLNLSLKSLNRAIGVSGLCWRASAVCLFFSAMYGSTEDPPFLAAGMLLPASFYAKMVANSLKSNSLSPEISYLLKTILRSYNEKQS